jgi:pimeloyl-ACP methyl ester carboxylesterase
MAPPILLIPGINGSARLYLGQIPDLWRLGPVSIANHTSGDSVGDIARRILDSAPAEFALVGFSFGGYLAFEILRQAPRRVRKLALVSTSARADNPEQSQRRRERMQAVRDGGFDDMLRLQFQAATHPGRRDDDALRANYVKMAWECGADAFLRHSQAAIGRPDSLSGLAKIRCPTTVIVGDSDAITPPALSREMAAGIAGAGLHIVANAGHLAPLEQPDEVARLLVDFLA